MIEHISYPVLAIYAGIGIACSQFAMGRMLRGNHTAPRSYHYLIGTLGALVVVAWPVAAVAYLNFLVAKAGHRAWLKMRG